VVVSWLMDELLKQLAEWMNSEEDEHLEFKEAKNQFNFDKLVRYCVALANEGGGRFILGITIKSPGKLSAPRHIKIWRKPRPASWNVCV